MTRFFDDEGRKDQMGDDTYNLVFSGDIAPGNTCEQVKDSLTSHFRMGSRQLDDLFAHTPFLLKHEVDYATALKHQILFEWAGLLSRIEPVSKQARNTPPEYCNVVFTGELREGYQIDDVKRNLMTFLRLTTKRVDELFAGHPVTLMQDVDSHPALKMQISFELAGALCRLETVKHDHPAMMTANTAPETQTMRANVAQMRCPKCDFRQPQSRKCRHCGCYVHTYIKKRPVSKELRLTQLARETDAAMKQELLYWGIGFSMFGALQSIGLGVWAMGFVGVGLLNLLLRRRSGLLAGRGMFLVNGLMLFGSGAWGLTAVLGKSVNFLYAGTGIRFGIERVESSMMVGGLLLWHALQIGAGIYGFGRFKHYVSTQQALSKKMRRITSKLFR